MSTVEENFPTDWSLAKAEFEKGASFRNISKLIGVSPSAVHQRSKRDGWHRIVDTAQGVHPQCTPAAPLQFRLSSLIKEAAFEIPTIAKCGRGIILMLMLELEAESSNPQLLEELIEAETAEDKTVNRRRLLEKAVSLPVRAMAAKNLATALTALTVVPGKKQQARLDAEEAVKGSDWGDDLDSDIPPTRPN